jgi:hypothetical protein
MDNQFAFNICRCERFRHFGGLRGQEDWPIADPVSTQSNRSTEEIYRWPLVTFGKQWSTLDRVVHKLFFKKFCLSR